MPNAPARKNPGFTVVEMVIVVAILTIIVAIAVPEVQRAVRTAKAGTCGAAMRQIETAKYQWKGQYPGVTPTKAQLSTYFPGGKFPTDPWGIGFQNETSLTNVVTHTYNNNAAFEPEGNCGPENGYNDAFQPLN